MQNADFCALKTKYLRHQIQQLTEGKETFNWFCHYDAYWKVEYIFPKFRYNLHEVLWNEGLNLMKNWLV